MSVAGERPRDGEADDAGSGNDDLYITDGGIGRGDILHGSHCRLDAERLRRDMAPPC